MSKQFYLKNQFNLCSFNVKTDLFPTIHFSKQKHFHFKQFSLAEERNSNVKNSFILCNYI